MRPIGAGVGAGAIMEYGTSRTSARRARPLRPGRGRARSTTAERVVAGVGLALSLAVGAVTVTAVVLDGGGPPPVAPAVAAVPADVAPAALRLWGLRATPQGTLVPITSADPVARTALEQLYGELLVPSR